MTHRARTPTCWLVVALVSALPLPALAAQAPLLPYYPLAPTPVLDVGELTTSPAFGGFISVRFLERNDSTGIQLNRARLTVMIAPVKFVGIRLQGDFSSGAAGTIKDNTVTGFTATDAYVELAPPDTTYRVAKFDPAVIVGQFKQPFSLEYLTAFPYLRTAFRSQVVDSLSPKRDIGLMGQVGYRQYVTLAFAITQGSGANATTNPDNAEQYIARLTLKPIPWLAIAAKVGNQSATHLWGYDARAEWHHLILEGEAIWRNAPAIAGVSQDANGGYVLGAYKVLPWLEAVYKWGQYDNTEAADGGAVDRREQWSTIGINAVTPQENLRLVLDWHIKSETPVEVKNNEFVAQVVAIF